MRGWMDLYVGRNAFWLSRSSLRTRRHLSFCSVHEQVAIVVCSCEGPVFLCPIQVDRVSTLLELTQSSLLILTSIHKMTFKLLLGRTAWDRPGVSLVTSCTRSVSHLLPLSPVKVMRLVCRDTAEEIILRRAESKLNLTSTVIEGGQFSHSTAVPGGVGNGSSQQLADILKFGLDRLLQSEEE